MTPDERENLQEMSEEVAILRNEIEELRLKIKDLEEYIEKDYAILMQHARDPVSHNIPYGGPLSYGSNF